jgi:hypothetical protein
MSHWDPLFFGEQGSVGVAVERTVDHHVEGRLALSDPSHAMGESGRPEARLPEEMALAAAAEHVGNRHTQVGDADLAMVVAARHGLDVAHDFPPIGRQVDDECRVGRLRQLRVLLGARDEDGESRAAGPAYKPFMPVDHPLLSVQDRRRLDEGRVGAGYLRFGHGKTGARRTFAQRAQISLLLFGSAPMQDRVLIAFVWGLAVEYERADSSSRCFRRNGRHRRRTQPHATPLGWHVRQPQAPVSGLGPQINDRFDGRPPVLAGVTRRVGPEVGLGGGYHVANELAHPEPHILDLGGEGEVDGHELISSLSSGLLFVERAG